MNNKYKNLFSPIQVGNTLFKNRIVSAPTGHPDVTLDGFFTEDAITYYERKAQGGAAAITLGEAIVDSKYGKRHPFQVSLDDERNMMHNLARVADSIKRHGAVPSIELQHSGFNATPGLVTRSLGPASDVVYAPSPIVVNGVEVQEMPEDIIWYIIDKFAKAANFCKRCGFGMVTIHGGHGWLINQFFSERLNKRTDKWGGSSENRARFAVEVADAIRKSCGPGFPIEMRISGTEAHDLGYGIEEGIKLAKALDGHVDIIHVSVGSSEGAKNKALVGATTHPSMFLEDGVNVKYAAEVKKHVTKSHVATVGALTDPAMMEEIISSGKADIVEMARGLIADPDLPIKALEGREDEIIRCMRCMNCFSHLTTHGSFWCNLNPVTSRERNFGRVLPPAKKQKVLVIGGGIAGMQAAITAEQAGHDVVLAEKTGRLGGNILCEENVPFKKHLKEYIEQRERIIKASKIDLKLNTALTPESAKEIGADVVIVAIGAEPVKPNIPGIDGSNVMSAEYAYTNPDKVKDTAVILGAGLVGLELCMYLNMLGKKAVVVEMLGDMNDGGNHLHTNAIRGHVMKDGLELNFNCKAVKIDEKGVTCETAEGERFFAGESVIYAVGQKSLSKEAASFYGSALHYHVLGDCVLPRNIGEATSTAMTVALDIGRF